MASGRLFLPGWMPARDSDGAPIPNVRAYFYQSGTDVLASVYADEALSVPLFNPVEANSSGRFPQIYASDSITYSASVDAPYGPAGQPFTFDGLEASQAADIAAANLAQGAAEDAEAALVATEAAIDAATQAGGGEAAVAGALAGQAAADAVVATKADIDAANVTDAEEFRTNISVSEALYSSITVNIPSDFPTLQAAVNALAEKTRRQGVRINLNIEAGHALKAGLTVANGDFSGFVIQSEDPVVYLDPAFVGVSSAIYASEGDSEQDPEDENDNLIQGFYAAMPVLDCVIDMENLHDNGYFGIEGCRGFVGKGAGVLNAGHDGLNFRSGMCTANESNFSGANNHGVRAAFGSTISCQQAFFDDCQKAGDGPGYAAIDVSRTSTLHGRLLKCRRSGGSGFNIRRTSRATLEEADFSDAVGNTSGAGAGGGVVQHSSSCSMFGINLSNIGLGYPLVVANTSIANANGCIITGYTGSYAIVVSDGGMVSVNSTVNVTDTVLGNFNVPTQRGIIFREDAPNYFNMGAFSATGATNGKTIGSSSVMQSSRSGTGLLSHQDFYNTSGLCGSIRTSGTSLNIQLSQSGQILTVSGGNPNGSVTAPPGSLCINISGGAATTLWVKESGTGNTGWIGK